MAGTLVGMTIPTSAFSATGSPSGGACFVHGDSQQTADALCGDIVARGISSGGHFYPPVTKKFFFAGASQWDATANDMARYRSLGTYVILALFPQTDGVKGDPSPGAWAAANPGGSYTDTTGVGGGSPIAAQAASDKTSMAAMLSNLAGAGWTAANCEIVLWQEPENNLTLAQWNVMLRTYGGVVNTAHGGVTFKLCADIGGSQGASVPTWVKAALGYGTTYGSGPASLGLPTIDYLGLDYYLGSGFPANPIDRTDSAGDSIVSLADQFGLPFGICECGCNPSTVSPLPARHDPITGSAGCTAYMQYILSFAQARIALGKPMRMINYWTANCNADGNGQLSSPIGLATGGQASLAVPDFRIALYQQWADQLTGTSPSFTQRQKSQNFLATSGVLSMWNNQVSPPSGGAATLNGSFLVAKIELGDCQNTTTVTGPAGWIQAPQEGKAGTATGQARAQLWYLPNCQTGLYGDASHLATFTCSNSGATVKGVLQEWTTPAATIQALDQSGGGGAVASATSLPVSCTAANTFTGDLALAMFAAVLTGSGSGQGWAPPGGWTGDGNASNLAQVFHSVTETAPAGTTSVTDAITLGTWTMTSWAGTVATFAATTAITLADTTGTLDPGTVGTAYSDAITALGGAAPYTVTLASGTLPTSVTLASSGALSGTPTVAGTYNFHTLITDCSQQTVSAAHTIIIAASAPTLAIGTLSLPPGTVGVPYPATALQATGGTPPYTWTVT